MAWGSWAAGILTGAALLVAGCAGRGALVAAGAEPGDASAPPAVAAALILGAEQLGGMPGQSVLDVVAADLPGVRVAQTSDCPTVQMRGPNPLPGYGEPAVYVDGEHAVNTCVLSELSAADVARVEVYPNGWTPRSGYPGTTGGLVLVFMKEGRG